MKRVLLAVVCALAVANLANAGAPCSTNTIRGTYAWVMQGQAFDGGISAVPGPGGFPVLSGTVLPVHFVGVATIGANGAMTGAYSGLFGLVPLGVPDLLPVSGTFTVHPDCTGEFVAPNGFGGFNTDKFVVLDNGKEIRTVGISGAPFRWQFTMKRIGRARPGEPLCGPMTARGSYVMRCEGFEVEGPMPPPAYQGVNPMFVFDVAADGTFAGRQFARDHEVEGVAVSGQMTVHPDCTVDTLMQTDALPGATIAARGVAYDQGREMFSGPVVAMFGGQPAPGAFAGFGCQVTRLAR